MKTFYEHINTFNKFDKQPVSVTESVTENEPSKTNLALDMAKRLASATPVVPESKTLTGMPVPN